MHSLRLAQPASNKLQAKIRHARSLMECTLFCCLSEAHNQCTSAQVHKCTSCTCATSAQVAQVALPLHNRCTTVALVQLVAQVNPPAQVAQVNSAQVNHPHKLHYRCTTVALVAQCTSCTSAQVALPLHKVAQVAKVAQFGQVASYYYVVGCPFYLLEAYTQWCADQCDTYFKEDQQCADYQCGTSFKEDQQCADYVDQCADYQLGVRLLVLLLVWYFSEKKDPTSVLARLVCTLVLIIATLVA